MRINKVENNSYNPNFRAKAVFCDNENLIPKGVKKTFARLCDNLGMESDEVYLSVSKCKNKEGKLEKVAYRGEVCAPPNFVTFYKKMPIWTSNEYSAPRNLLTIYEGNILPIFGVKKQQINKGHDVVYNKLTHSVENPVK